MKLYITDSLIKVEQSASLIFRVPTSQVTNIATMPVSTDYRYTIESNDEDNPAFSFMHSQISKYYVDGVEVLPVSAFAVILAKLESVCGITSVSGTTVDDAAFTPAAGKGFVVMGINSSDAIDSGDAGAIAVTGSREVKVYNADFSSIKTAVETLDNAIDGNYLNVNLNVAGTDVSAGAGSVDAQTVRVTIASDDANLTELLSRTPEMGQALADASIPVVLTADQISTLTPPAAITGFAVESGGNLDTIAGAVDGGHLQVDVLTVPTTTVEATDLDIRALDSASDSVEVVQGTAADLNCTEANSGDIKSAVESLDDKIPALGQALADASIPVVLTADQISTLTPPAAITGFAVESGGNLDEIVSRLPELGQALAAASIPVVLTSDQISTLTPPAAITGFAKEADGNLAELVSRTPELGQALADASVPVVLTAAQISTLTPPAAITNFANETGGNLATLAGKVGNTETPTMAVLSTDTTIAAGAKMVTIKTGSTFAGTILTATAEADTAYTFIASAGNTLAAIAVTRSAGDFTVLKVV